ncbi:aldo/keto reductase [Flavivirga spongiicola]|uniref:Aldo/keto reductase n=1 Tax=Flavivirga spongiicola TaxID=421621 RepID=A0ABU7XTU6_9FLAO|nr:aldo/keto reductase [Flavivirga sp. MEBiC05379]MDO5978854.1 aldo/keto reductase [Flavivirga sp. MEBiC05379]
MGSSKLILGTVQFGLDYGINNNKGKPSESIIKEILDIAYEKGIQYLDTAEAYGNSQERIGTYHRKSLNKFNIITKFSSSVKELSDDIETRVLENTKILGVENLYCYMFHSFKDFNFFFEKYQKDLISLKNRKIIRKIGVSIYTNDELEKVLNFDNIDLIQLPFNLFDNNKLRGEVIRRAKVKGIEIHTRSVFLQGLFFKGKENLQGNLIDLKPYVENIENLSKNNHISINDLALNYACNNENIDKVLIGVDDVNQLKMNLDSVNKLIDQKVFTEIDKIEVKEKKLLNPSNW